jgi:hypothetical protein
MKQTLKKLSVFMLAFTLTVASMDAQAQVPQKFNYQGIARDAKGNPLSQQRMTLKLTVLPTSDATEGEYEEIQTVTTNEFGLYTLQIGNGSPLKGEMSAVKWETGNKYIKVAIDPKGGSDFVDAGTNQLLSVPYAIYADKAGVAKNSGSTSRATNNFIEKTNGSGVVNSTSQIYDNGTNIGIGTTSPVARVHVNTATAGLQEHIRMQNTSTTGAGRFTLYNSNSSAYATFTKYGTNYAGGYTGISSLYPYANLLAFGNNDTNGAGNGNFLISTEGNTGISIFKGGTSKLKYHVDYATERVGIGGNAVPAARVHANNTDGTSMELMLSNNTTGHTATDGFMIQQSGSDVNLNNKENGNVRLWSNNLERARITAAGDVGIGTTAPTAKLDVNGQIRMQGGSPGAGKIMTSNATGVGSWSTAAAAGLVSGSGTTDYIPKFTPNGNTLGNSSFIDGTTSLLYNSASNPSPNYSVYSKLKNNGGSNWVVNEGNKAYGYTFLAAIDSSNSNKGMFFGQSSAALGLSDSVGFIYYNPTSNNLNLGSNYYTSFSINQSSNRMGNNIGNAHFNINTTYDTAGNFESNTSNYTSGILRGRYTGSLVNDHVAVSGYSNPDPTTDYGIGVRGEGGFYGVQGISQITGSANYGVSGYATSNGYSYGLTGYAGDNGTSGGNKYGAYTQATGGTDNYGLYATVPALIAGNGTGVYALGKQTGVYGQADSASASQTDWMGANLGYKEAIGVMGKGNALGNPSSTSNVGVAGSATSTGNWFNVGVFGEAVNAGANYAIFGRAPVAASSYAGYFIGNVNISGNIAKSSGTFKIDHPQDPANKYLIHSFVESPDMMNVYNGNITTDANGNATVSLPSYFEAENKDFKYQLTVVDNSADFVMAKVSEKVSNNTFKIKTSKPNVEVSWQVTGVRQDAYANAHRIVDVVDKAPEDKGYYIHPELFGAPPTQTVGLKGNPNAERHFLPSAEDHKKAMEDKKRNELEHLQKQQEAQSNWKPQELPKNTSNNGTGSLVPVK